MAALAVGLVLMGYVHAADSSGWGELLVEPEQVEAAAPEPVRDAIDRRLDCIERYESRGNPLAYNRTSGASGLLQFLPSTWRSTPYGHLSIWDGPTQRLAGRWMLERGRAREWVPVQRGWC